MEGGKAEGESGTRPGDAGSAQYMSVVTGAISL